MSRFVVKSGRGSVPAEPRRTKSQSDREKGTQVAGGADTVITTFTDAPPTTTVSWGKSGVPQVSDIYLLFWGSQWKSNPPPSPSAEDIFGDITRILAGPYLSRLKQYYVNQTPTVTLAAIVTGGAGPRSGIRDSDVGQFVANLIDVDNIGFSNAAVYVVMLPPGIKPHDTQFNGLHYQVYETVGAQEAYFAWVEYDESNGTTRDNISESFSHELVEMLTDPGGDSLQVNPRNSDSWHEICDVCESTARVNGVLVASYWSDSDKACVVPIEVPVMNRQITCITKNEPVTNDPADVRKAHLDPHHAIGTVGGISIESGQRFSRTQKEVIKDIQQGMNYFVIGADGSRANVIVRVVFPPWDGAQGVMCIATTRDRSIEDNLLSLPQC